MAALDRFTNRSLSSVVLATTMNYRHTVFDVVLTHASQQLDALVLLGPVVKDNH